MPSSPQLLPRANAKQMRANGKQYYLDANGDKLPSVSTILNATKPQEDRERLFNWRQRVGAVEANQISGAASRRGTGTHKQIQRYLEGKNSPCPDSILPYWQSIETVLQEVSNIKLVEGTVFNYKLKYAGIVDCVASLGIFPVFVNGKLPISLKVQSSVCTIIRFKLLLTLAPLISIIKIMVLS